MAETLATSGRRVKVYVLNGAGKWDDRGTGHVRVETDPNTKAQVVKVTSDETGRVSLTSTIRATHEAFYQIQEDNIISWNEEIPVGVPTEVALSFQETEGCRELWEKIGHVDAAFKRNVAHRAAASRTQPAMNSHSGGVQSGATDATSADPLASENVPPTTAENLHHHANPTDGVPLVDPTAPDATHSRFFEDNLESTAWNADAIDDVVFPDTTNVLFLGNSPASFIPASSADAAAAASFAMPEPDRAGVETLARIMSDQTMLSMRAVREEIIAEVLTSDYITKLCQVFRRAEREGDLECLAMLYHVIRCLFVIGNNGVLEILVSERHLMDIVGCLEYDQEQIPEVERKKAESKRKEEAKKPSSSPKSKAERESQNTGDSSHHQGGAETRPAMEARSEETKPGAQNKETLRTDESVDVAATSPRQSAMDIDRSKKCLESKEGQTLSTEKNSGERDCAETNAAKTDIPTKYDAESAKPTTDQNNEGLAEKNNSEETSSSGNIPDGEVPRFSLRTHRDYLERKVSYRSVVPINDQSVVAKIHQNYRVAYIRDVILSRVFDDGMSHMLSGVILCNNADIIMYFISGSNALQELFSRLRTTVQNWRRMQEATETSGERTSRHCEPREFYLSKRQIEKGVPTFREVKPNVKDVNDSDKSLAKAHSGEDKGYSAKSRHGRNSNSSSDLATSPTSNPMSLTTTESDPATDPNAMMSGDRSSRVLRRGEKTRLDSATGDPKCSEQSEEIHEDLRSMLGLLRELCQIVKGQQPPVQVRFHQMLLELGALEISVALLLDKDRVLRSLCCDILSTAIYHDQGDVRAHIIKNATQQDSSVPKQQIGSRRASPGAKPIEGGAIVTKAGASGVTAEVAIREERIPMYLDEKKSSDTNEECDVDISKRESQSKVPKGTGQFPSNDEGVTVLKANDDGIISVLISKDGSEPSRPKRSQDSTNPITGTVRSPATAVLRKSPELEVGGIGTHPMVSACLGVAGKAVKVDSRNEVFRLYPMGTENQSRVKTDFPLLSAMMEVICQDKESGVALTVLDLLRMLLDPMNMKPSPEKNMFLNVFYEKFLFCLMAPIEVAAHPERRNDANALVSVENVSHICDLMSYCVSHHAFRSKYFVLGNNVGGKIVELLRHKRAHVRLSGVRFVRTCVGMRDEVYDRYVVEKRLIDPIMEMYARNEYKDNLISSSVLDLVGFLTNAKREFLLRHVIREYSTTLQPGTTNCSVFEDAKRVLSGIEKDQALNSDGKSQSRHSDMGSALHIRAGELGSNEQRGLSDKSSTDGVLQTRVGVFLGHIEDGEFANQMAAQSSTSRDGSGSANVRFGPALHEHDMRFFNEEDAFFSRLTGASNVIHKVNSTDQEAAELQTKPALGGASLSHGMRVFDQGSVRTLETRGLATPRGILSKGSPFKTGLRSVSQSALPKRGQGGLKNILPTGLRSQVVSPMDVVNPKLPNKPEARRRSPEMGHTILAKGKPGTPQSDYRDAIMTDDTAAANQGASSSPNVQDAANEAWSGKAMRLSLSKSNAKNGSLDQLGEKEEGVLLSESSEDRHSPRKRERVNSDNSIETCTTSVLGRCRVDEDSPPKRRRTEDETSATDQAKKSSEVLGFSKDSSENVEGESKIVERAIGVEERQQKDWPRSNRLGDGQEDREKRR